MGEYIIMKINNIKRIIFPSKKINIFTLCILLLGIIAGAIFVNIIGFNDKNLVLDKIKLFINNINDGSINTVTFFKNSISTNLLYVIIIWVLGLTMVGILFNIFILFIKGFIFSFSIASFILTYGYKGIILSLLYLLFGQFLNIVVILMVSIYSIMISTSLLKLIFKDDNISIRKQLKNYFIILLIAIIISIISSLFETFLLPSFIKLLIKLFI